MNAGLADRLEIWGVEDDVVIFRDGSLGFGLDVTPVDLSCRADDDVNSYASRIVQFLNGLPSGIDIQFVQDIQAGNIEIIEAHQKLATPDQDPLLKSMLEQRVSRLKALDADGFIPSHSLKIFVRKKPQESLLEKPRLLSKEKMFETVAEGKLRSQIATLLQLRKDIVANLKSIELESTPMTADRILNLVYEQWNPKRHVERPPHDPEDVRSHLLFTDVGINDNGFSLSDIHYRIVSLKFLPQETIASMARCLRELPFGSRLFVSIHVPDQQKEIEHLQSQRRIAFSMAKGKKAGVSDLESESKFQDLESLLEKMISEGEKVFQVSINILLKSSDPSLLEADVTETLMKLREMAGAEGMVETLASFDIFSELSLPNARAKERTKRIKSSNLADLLPLCGPWPGHEKPSILLRSRMGSLVPFDPFSPRLSNYNHIISGGSGSGKSFLTNILLLQMLKENPRIFIIDIGGSYRKLCDNLNGQYISMGVESGFSMNPFDLAAGETTPSNHKVKFLVGILELMTKEEGSKQLPRFERSELEAAILEVYRRENPSLSLLREILMEHSEPQIRKLGQILGSWSGDSPYGKIIDRPTNIEFKRPIVSFDLKGMESYPDLQAVTLFMITDFVWREVQKDRTRPKLLIFDECWKLLENESGSAFIGEVFRTFRKYFAGTIAISQNLDDFAKSRVADAILTNSAIKWIFMQKGADQKRLREVLQLNDNEMALISSLRQERGVFSEVFLMAENNRSVAAIEAPPLEYWIATTDPRDLAKIEELSKGGISTIQILNELSEKYPNGVAVSRDL